MSVTSERHLGPQNELSDMADMHVRHVRTALGPKSKLLDVTDMHVRHVRKAPRPPK